MVRARRRMGYRPSVIDENAFGFLVTYFGVEEEEYALERQEFVERFEAFRATVLQYLEAFPAGRDARVLCLGHAVYVEIAEGDEVEAPIAWLKAARARLAARGFETVGVLSHGSRWVDGEGPPPCVTERIGDFAVTHVSSPSEPLRRVLYADAASRHDDEDEESGWGPGLYLDTEAVDALGLTPKNSPTTLRTAGAAFYRAGA